jgi:hypothetical protein
VKPVFLPDFYPHSFPRQALQWVRVIEILRLQFYPGKAFVHDVYLLFRWNNQTIALSGLFAFHKVAASA